MKAQQIVKKLRAWKRKTKDWSVFVRRDLWDLDLLSLSWGRSLGVRALRVVCMVFKGFRDDECAMHASALTFSTLMSIVPILALMLSMARGLGDADTAKNWVQDRVRDWTSTFQSAPSIGFPDTNTAPAGSLTNTTNLATADMASQQSWAAQDALAERINAMVESGFDRVDKINFTTLGTLGLVILIGMVIGVLGRVERSFNRVWGITRGRSVWRRFTDYMSVLLILPILIAAAASVPVLELVTQYMPDHTADLLHRFVESGFFKNLVIVIMTTLTFSFVILFMPNTSMRFSSGLSGGFIAAVLFLGWMWLCAMAQVGVARYGRIYGSFAVVPIVLAWVHVSWQIMLFGAEVAFSVENAATYKMEQRASEASLAASFTLAVMILRQAGLALQGKKESFEVGTFVRDRKVPVRFVHAVVEALRNAGYLGPLAGSQEVYVLLRAPEQLRMRDLLHKLLHAGADTSALGLHASHVDTVVSKAVSQVLGAAEGTLDDMTVASLLQEKS